MSIMVGRMAQTGKHDIGAVTEGLHWIQKHKAERKLTGNGLGILNLKAHPISSNKTMPRNPSQIILPTWDQIIETYGLMEALLIQTTTIPLYIRSFNLPVYSSLQWVYFESQKILWVFEQLWECKTTIAFKVVFNTFFIVKWPVACGCQSWNVTVCMWDAFYRLMCIDTWLPALDIVCAGGSGLLGGGPCELYQLISDTWM